MKKLCFVLFAWILMQTPLSAETILVNNTNRNYIVYAPKDLGTNRPLLISCHGMGQGADYQKGMLKIEPIADTAKFVTVFPSGINKAWDIGGDSDIKFMEAIIDEMVEKYSIDRNRVYLSGFSMGGMFTYHAMNRMADKIAAFAPISGYPLHGGGNYTSSRPVPIIHTHGTADDVVGFSGVAGLLANWVKRNGCPTQATVIKPYKANHVTRHTWGPGENGVEVVLLEMANKGHWVSNDVVLTGEEIWNFCKRFSLEMKEPSVKITSPESGLTYITFGGTTEVAPVTVKATASDPDGQVVKVAFYLGEELISEQTEEPFSCTIDQFVKGENVIRVVATDDEGRTGSSKKTILVEEPSGSYVFSKAFNSEGSVPEGWTTYDGKEKRVGFSSGYSSGSRVFHFTGEQKDFEWGLYTRNVTGASKEGYARFADKETSTTLTLYPGNYQLLTRISNWNKSEFSPVTVAVEDVNGESVFAQTFTPTSNIGNSATNDFSGTTLKTFTFDVLAKGRYFITLYTADAAWADLVIGQIALMRKGKVSSISGMTSENPVIRVEYYNMAGLCVDPTGAGMYICKNTYKDGTFKSRLIVNR